MEALEFAKKICESLDSHKAEDIVCIDVRGKTEVADYYVVAGGRSMTHTRSLIDNVEMDMDKIGIAPIRLTVVLPFQRLLNLTSLVQNFATEYIIRRIYFDY